jgi:nucleoside-diphosphate-sugar epimerase
MLWSRHRPIGSRTASTPSICCRCTSTVPGTTSTQSRPTALIKKCLDAIDLGEPEIDRWGDGTPTREVFDVGDCAEGIALAAESLEGSDPINLGAGRIAWEAEPGWLPSNTVPWSVRSPWASWMLLWLRRHFPGGKLRMLATRAP